MICRIPFQASGAGASGGSRRIAAVLLASFACAALPPYGAEALGSKSAGAEPGPHLEKSPPDSGPVRFDSTLDPLSGYVQVRSAGFAGWADTGLYIGTQMGRFPQVHRVAAPGADRRQVTFFTARASGFHLNPVPVRKNLLYLEDQGGNEAFRIRLHDLETGAGRKLGAPPGRVEGVVWNDSGTAFAYSHTPAGTDRWDLRLGRTDGRDTLLLSLPGTWSVLDVRPDGRRLLAQKYVSASEAELFILDLTNGALTPLLPGEKPAYADHGLWVRTGGREGDSAWSVAFTSDREGEFHRLYLAAGPQPMAWSDSADWDVEWVSPSPDRRTLVYSLNEEGYSRLYLVSARNLPGPGRKPARALADIPRGVINEVVFRPRPGRPGAGRPGAGRPGAGSKSKGSALGGFAFTLNTPTGPGDVYSHDIDRAKTTRWTFSESGGLPSASFRAPKLIRYPSFDSLPSGKRRTIPAWLYLPDARVFPGPRPTLILIHGGPEQQARPGFDPFLQFLVGRLGMAVAQPNVRGSTGYGRNWQKADDGYLRMNSVKDVGALIDWIGVQPAGGAALDPARLSVSGRSYGGFMSLSALIEYGPRLRAGISTVGITHFPSFLEKTSGYRRDLRRSEYGDERDPRMASFLDGISPLTRLDRIVTPLLLCHGRNDPRVPYAESERIFSALKGRKVPVWFLTFGDEGHAVKDQENQLVQWRTTAEFLLWQSGLLDR